MAAPGGEVLPPPDGGEYARRNAGGADREVAEEVALPRHQNEAAYAKTL